MAKITRRLREGRSVSALEAAPPRKTVAASSPEDFQPQRVPQGAVNAELVRPGKLPNRITGRPSWPAQSQSPDPAITSESRLLTHGLTRARVGFSGLALGAGKGSGRLSPRMAAGKRALRLPASRELGGGAGDDRTGEPGSGGSWPAQGGPRRPRAGDRDAEERVRTRSADEGRVRRASGPGDYRADLRRAGRAHRRHPGHPGHPAAARPASPSAPARRGPLVRAAAGAGSCLVIAVAAVWVAGLADPGGPGPDPYHSWARLCLFVAFFAVVTALCIVINGVGTAVEQRRSGGQLPPRPGPGGYAPDGDQRGSVGHGEVSPGPRPDQTQADVQAHKSRQRRPAPSRPGGPGSARRQAGVGRGVTPMRPAPESAPPRLRRHV